MRPILFLPFSVLCFVPVSCKKKEEPGAMGAMPPAHVTFVPAAEETITITRDLPGRIHSVRVAEVRARVPGILLKKVFEEGSDVKAGDVMFEIDPAPLQAALQSAKAQLARAEANAEQAETLAGRYRKLVADRAVSKQEADTAESNLAAASAEVLAAKAALEAAGLDLGYATVTAPISGRVGKADVTEGALVGQGTPTLLATIQQLDPVYFDFTQSSGDFLAMKKSMEGKDAKVTLVLDDGSEYRESGKLLFAETSVDESTGMVSLRAEFPNPKRELLPGMFARGKVVQAVFEKAITVPQRAVTRKQGGMGNVLVIGAGDQVEPRTIRTSHAVDDKWIVSSGLKPGERVIIEGISKAVPGTKVEAQPFAPEASAGDAPQH